MVAGILYLTSIVISFITSTYLSSYQVTATGSIILKLLMITPQILIGVGFIVAFVSGRKGNGSPAGIMCIKVSTLIIGIPVFIVLVIASILLVIAFFSTFIILFESSTEGIIAFAMMFILASLVIVITVFQMMFTVKIVSVIGRMRDFERNPRPIKTGFLQFVLIANSVLTVLGLIFILSMVASGNIMSELIRSLPSDMVVNKYEIANVMYLYFSKSFVTLTFLSSIIEITFNIIVVIMLSKAHRIYTNYLYGKASVNVKPVSPVMTNTAAVNETNQIEYIKDSNESV